MRTPFARRLMAALSTLVVLCGLLTAGVFTATSASAGTDDYPSQWRNAPMDSIVDSWGEYNRECTSFVAWRLHARNGFEMPFHDNATGWGADATTYGYPVNMTPAVGSVAWWSSGHVAWVEAVNGSNVTIEEYNLNYTGTYSERTIAANSVSGYIHFRDLPSYHYQPFVGDFNGDGLADIGLRDASTGIFFIKHGTSFGDQISYAWAAGTNYQPFAGDFNGDGLADIGLRDASTGIFFVKHGPGFGDQISYAWAAGTNYQPFVGDFNGDGLADIGLRDASTGMIYIKHGPGFNDQISYAWAAGTNYQVFAGDFNGDGLADIGLRDASTGIFFVKHGPGFGDQISYAWAAGTNYQPFVGDFNGDGLADIGLRDADIGVFYIKHGTSFGDQITYPWAAG